MTRSILTAVAVLILLGFVGAGTAHALTSFTLNGCNPISIPGDTPAVVGGCGTGPYGTVTLTQVGANVSVTVALDNGYYFTDSSGAGKSIYFDLNTASTATIAIITSGFSLDSGSVHGGAIDGAYTPGTGTWNYAIECGDVSCPGGAGGNHLDAATLTFTVDGVTISNFVPNADGNMFAVSVFSSAANGGAGGSGQAVVTPEPESMFLFGSGLLLLGALFRKKLPVS